MDCYSLGASAEPEGLATPWELEVADHKLNLVSGKKLTAWGARPFHGHSVHLRALPFHLGSSYFADFEGLATGPLPVPVSEVRQWVSAEARLQVTLQLPLAATPSIVTVWPWPLTSRRGLLASALMGSA